MRALSELTLALHAGLELDGAAVAAAADCLLDGAFPVAERADFLRALAGKGETAGEITGFVRAFLEHAVRPPLQAAELDRPAVDVCGTGGDGMGLFNVSTTSMFVLAAGGCAVVKHGNRGITSKSGGADVLEALGVPVSLPPDRMAECVRRHGAAFLLAPQYHPAFKAVAPVRALLAAEKTRTVFNIIGPLLNPVQPPFQLAGVFDPSLLPAYAGILHALGRRAAWAVHGRTGCGRGTDEVSTMGPTMIQCAGDSAAASVSIPLPLATPEELQGGDARENAALLTDILAGTDTGPRRHIVLANASAAFQVCGLADTWEDGIARAEEAIDSGRAAGILRALQDFR